MRKTWLIKTENKNYHVMESKAKDIMKKIKNDIQMVEIEGEYLRTACIEEITKRKGLNTR